jgi:hypothetical protein
MQGNRVDKNTTKLWTLLTTYVSQSCLLHGPRQHSELQGIMQGIMQGTRENANSANDMQETVFSMHEARRNVQGMAEDECYTNALLIAAPPG